MVPDKGEKESTLPVDILGEVKAKKDTTFLYGNSEGCGKRTEAHFAMGETENVLF